MNILTGDERQCMLEWAEDCPADYLYDLKMGALTNDGWALHPVRLVSRNPMILDSDARGTLTALVCNDTIIDFARKGRYEVEDTTRVQQSDDSNDLDQR